jgi:hypothetical protein
MTRGLATATHPMVVNWRLRIRSTVWPQKFAPQNSSKKSADCQCTDTSLIHHVPDFDGVAEKTSEFKFPASFDKHTRQLIFKFSVCRNLA